jgi:hypothetical protein
VKAEISERGEEEGCEGKFEESKEIGRNTRKLTIIGARVKKTAN